MAELDGLDVPVLVVASRDDADPLHPLTIAEEYVRRLPDAALVVEEPGQAPLAWQGGRLTRTIVEFLESRLPRG
jgi:pimeloyl-ACP methyl ester carboxylesterase